VRYLLFAIMALLLAAAGCDMPGVAKVREEMNDSVDELADQIQDIDQSGNELLTRIEALEIEVEAFSGIPLGAGPDYEMPDFEMPDISGITEEVSAMHDSLTASLLAVNTSLADMQTSLETMTAENDSLTQRIEDLQDDVDYLQYRLNNMTSGGSGSSGSGGTRTSSGSTGGTSGGSTGGSSGGSTR
jgi:uncharacterized protein YoxC